MADGESPLAGAIMPIADVLEAARVPEEAGRWDEALAIYHDALERWRPVGGAPTCDLLRKIGLVHYHRGDLEGALGFFASISLVNATIPSPDLRGSKIGIPIGRGAGAAGDRRPDRPGNCQLPRGSSRAPSAAAVTNQAGRRPKRASNDAANDAPAASAAAGRTRVTVQPPNPPPVMRDP